MARYSILIFIISLIGIGIIDRGKLWSPYNRLNIVPGYWQANDGQQVEVGYTLDVQETFYQTALNLTPDNIQKIDQSVGKGIGKYLQDWSNAYNLPYKLVPLESRVLVVGSGTGIIFSESLRRAGSTAKPLASNFCGSAVGGILEYGSILWGIKSLYIVALVLYLGAFIASLRIRLSNLSLIPKALKRIFP